MPNGQPKQLANLTPFGTGPNPRRASAAVLRALTKCRGLSPESVDLLAAIMRDPEEPSALRVRCAEIILDKAMPRPKARDDHVIIAADQSGGP